MSRLKILGLFAAWLLAIAALYSIEAWSWPEMHQWDMFNWRYLAVSLLNVVAVNGTYNKWKALRKGDE